VGCVFGDDEEAVGSGECSEVAGTLPGNSLDEWEFIHGRIERAEGREETRETGFGLAVSIARELGEDEARVNLSASGKGGDYGNGEEQERCGRGDGIAWQAKEYLSALLAPASWNLAKDERFSGLNLDAGEMELSAEPGERWFDEVAIAGGDPTRDEKDVSLGGLFEGRVERFRGVGCGGEHDGFSAVFCDESGEHRSIGVADFAGTGCRVDGNELVASGEDGDARAREDFDRGITAGSGEGDLRGADRNAGFEDLIAAAGLRSSGDDVLSRCDGS